MDDAASALILSWTAVLRRTLGCTAKLFIYHAMFQRWPAALRCGYWLKEWDQGHERTTQVFRGGLSLRESSWRSDVWDQPLEVVPASPLDVSCQTSPFGGFLGDPNKYRIHWKEYIFICSPGKTCVSSVGIGYAALPLRADPREVGGNQRWKYELPAVTYQTF